jgi:hypothetical protein
LGEKFAEEGIRLVGRVNRARQRKPELVDIPFLDLKAEGIASIVWATGFRCNFDWIDLSVLDPRGYPLQYRGITPFTGLYFCGLHRMHCLKSGLFFGVGETAQHVTNHLLSRDRDTASAAVGRKNRRIPAAG